MKTSHTLLRAVFCGFAIAATAAFATTINYSGNVTAATGGPYNIGDPWQLSVVLQEPLTDLNGGSGSGVLGYNIANTTMAIKGTVRNTGPSAPINFPFLAYAGADDSSGSGGKFWGNVLWNFAFTDQSGMTGIASLLLLATTAITDQNGMLLPMVPGTVFAQNAMQYFDAGGSIEGIVTSYSVVPADSVPDASTTIGLLGFGLAGVLLLTRRVVL